MKVTTVGLDLAKSVFQVHAVDERGRVAIRKALKRDQVLVFFARLERCVVGMEACGGAHYWASKLAELGHEAKLMAPQYVKPYVKTNKNDKLDAEAICEAVGRPNMRFVPIKNVEQQTVLSLHRARQGFVKGRTAQANQIRGLLGEFGVVIAKGVRNVRSQVPLIVGDDESGLPVQMRELLRCLLEELKHLDEQVEQLELQIKLWHRENEASRRIADVRGVGVMTATALVATIGDGRHFQSGRHASAWVGIVPRQHSSGGKATQLGISKRGDVYLRTLLIHGARSVLQSVRRKAVPDPADRWLAELAARRNPNVAAVALANKNMRTCWALLAHGRKYDPHYQAAATIATAAAV